MDVKDKALLLFQLGPVQSFIAQAATIADLKAGSEMLSTITATALKKVIVEGNIANEKDVVFPALKDNPDMKGIPNRFLVFVPREPAKTIAENAVKAAREKLKELSNKTKAKLNLSPELCVRFDKQVEAFLQTSWAILNNPTGEMGRDYKNIGKLLAWRRNTRPFEAWGENEHSRKKDFLSGREEALNKDGLGAMNLIKRNWGDSNKTNLGDSNKMNLGKLKEAPYLAVLVMDGDRMGEHLSGMQTIEEHQNFSSKLASFANSVHEEIPKTGCLIYAGGDDVVAVVEAKDAFRTAKAIQEKFTKEVNGLHLSAGVAIGSSHLPLQELIAEARKAESRAKHTYERNAMAVSVLKRSGEILEWGCHWDSKAFVIYDSLLINANCPENSGEQVGRFAYKLASFLVPYCLDKGSMDEKMREVILVETQHVMERTEGMKNKLDMGILSEYLKEDLVKDNPKLYLGLFLVEDFVDRPREENN